MTSGPASPKLTHFIRQTLGCGCPPEVFERVGDAPTQISRNAGIQRRIDVGGRLLVYLVAPADSDQAISDLAAWIAAGRSERDATGMNRLRLVLAMDQPDPREVARLERAFAEAVQGDERLHLHIIAPGSCPIGPDALD